MSEEIIRLEKMLEYGKIKYHELTYKGKGRGNILRTNNAIKKKLKELKNEKIS